MADKQAWRVSLGLAGVGIAGAVLGYTVQHLFGLERDRSRAFEERTYEAYVAFVSGFHKYQMARQEEAAGRTEKATELDAQYELETATAVGRIALYGHKRVVESMAEWYRRYPLRPCDDSVDIEITIWETMRETSLGDRQRVSRADLAAVAVPCSLAGGR